MKPSTPLESCDQRDVGGMLGVSVTDNDNALILLKIVFAVPAVTERQILAKSAILLLTELPLIII